MIKRIVNMKLNIRKFERELRVLSDYWLFRSKNGRVRIRKILLDLIPPILKESGNIAYVPINH
jgi:hypothetical protein